ncbi:hydrolase [Actinoplanes sp. NPDC051475]|uniref:dienelactone hydrolase family protein n=1 Tax=Actinoplanes sp. NPDC051475 TaxID=3157225 RepID=UPI00344EC0CB
MARIAVAGGRLPADLVLPDGATGVVAFAHGSESSRHDPANRAMAEALNLRGLGTILVDLMIAEEKPAGLMTAEEEPAGVGALADRLVAVVDWLGEHGPTSDLEVGLFGAGAGAAVVLLAAAARPDPVRAVVCHGGRPDLVGPALVEVAAPTLFLVGERDVDGIELDREACATMTVTAELRIVPGDVDRVAEQAGDWFAGHLEPRPAH